MEHLSLEIFSRTGTDSEYAYLPKGTSIPIVDTSEIFASGDVWSLSFTLNVYANAHIFGTSGDIHGSRLHEQIDRRRARLWVEGLPLYLGYLRLGSEAEVDKDGNVDVSFEGGRKTFGEMVDGAKANQVPMMDDVKIGVALWRKRWAKYWLELKVSATFGGGSTSESVSLTKSGEQSHGHSATATVFTSDGDDENTAVQQYPRMVFPKGEFESLTQGVTGTVNCLNTDRPYSEDGNGVPSNPYCNIALCYQKYGYEKKMDDGSLLPKYNEEPEAQRGYEYMPANRVNSAPNFFVIYWLRALMKHLGIYIEENQMLGVQDMCRLFFVNTNCAYREPKHIRTAPDAGYGRYMFTDDGVGFTSRTRLVAEYIAPEKLVKTEECKFYAASYTVGSAEYSDTRLQPSDIPDITGISVKVAAVEPMTDSDKNEYNNTNSYLHDAFATSDCFPDEEISTVLQALENGFGIRFLFDRNFSSVRIVLLRNIFRDTDIQTVVCEITDNDVKVENNIRGFRMTYGDNKGNTEFFYKGFDDKLPKTKPYFADNSDTHDYSHWNLNAQYANIIKKVSAFDRTCYVTPDTGNAYGIKIDEHAKRYEELHPATFEFAGYMDAEDGDCTGEEETIKTINVGFVPAIMNDLNAGVEDGEPSQRFALFVDEKMRPRRPELNKLWDRPGWGDWTPASYNDPDVFYDTDKLYRMYGPNGTVGNMTSGDGIVKPGEFAITSDMFASKTGLTARLKTEIPKTYPIDEFPYFETVRLPVEWNLTASIDGSINEGYRLYLQDNYEPNDSGISPVETHDWGLMLGIMRGSGGDAYIRYEGDPDDGEGNSTWEIMPGSSATSHPDTCDNYGNEWDYNGNGSGIGSRDGRFSLKLRAEKPNPYYNQNGSDSSTSNSDEQGRYLTITNSHLRGRGLADQFYKEYSYWVRNARILKRTVRMELAQLLAIDKTKRVKVGDVMGFVRKISFTVDDQTGLGDVTMEIMYI